MFVLRQIFLLLLGSIRKEQLLQLQVALIGRAIKRILLMGFKVVGAIKCHCLTIFYFLSSVQTAACAINYCFPVCPCRRSTIFSRSAAIAKITPDNNPPDNCFNESDFRNGICTCGWMLMMCKHGDKEQNTIEQNYTLPKEQIQRKYLQYLL